MTTCYHLLAGALPDARRESAQLLRRLESTSWPSLPDDGTWHNGVPAGLAQWYVEARARWLQQPQEPALGRHEVVAAEGGEVQLVRFEGAGRVPILLHGWPTSFLAFHRVIDRLLEFASELVLATLPGFGSSSLPSPGPSIEVVADLLLAAMSKLGHHRFVVHGQDWGSVVAREVGVHAPDRVLGVHFSAALRGFMADGHVAALDAPAEFIADLTDFITRIGADQ